MNKRAKQRAARKLVQQPQPRLYSVEVEVRHTKKWFGMVTVQARSARHAVRLVSSWPDETRKVRVRTDSLIDAGSESTTRAVEAVETYADPNIPVWEADNG